MSKLFTKEQARKFLKENNLKDGESIADALRDSFKELIQEALEAEMDQKLGYSKYDWSNKETDNCRNGHHKKTVRSKFGNVELNIPEDKKGEFEPVIVPKHSREAHPSINDMILSMYAKGMSTPDIHSHMNQIYGIDVSAEMQESQIKYYALQKPGKIDLLIRFILEIYDHENRGLIKNPPDVQVH